MIISLFRHFLLSLMGIGIFCYTGCAPEYYSPVGQLTDKQLLQRYHEVDFWLTYWRDNMVINYEDLSQPEIGWTSEEIYAESFAVSTGFRLKIIKDLLDEQNELLSEIEKRHLLIGNP
jgi:hypothetical protein